MKVRRVAGVVLAAALLGVVGCSAGGSADSHANSSGGSSSSGGDSPTPGFTTSCQMVNAGDDSGNATFNITVSVTPQKAADITDVDVEMTKQGAPLPIASSAYPYSDGGNGVLISKLGADVPAFVSAGKTWTFGSGGGPNARLISGSGLGMFQGAGEFNAMPDSCHVMVVATSSNPGNF